MDQFKLGTKVRRQPVLFSIFTFSILPHVSSLLPPHHHPQPPPFNKTHKMTSVQVGPPDLKTVDPTALAVAKFLRHHKELKQREGIMNEKRHQFFRGMNLLQYINSDPSNRL